MKLLVRIKIATGLLLIVISIIGCYPLLSDITSGNVISNQSTGAWMNSADKPITEYRKSLMDTNYPILLGCFSLSGALLIGSIKIKQKYGEVGVTNIENPQILSLNPFTQIAKRPRIMRGIFNSPEEYNEAVRDLENELYKEA